MILREEAPIIFWGKLRCFFSKKYLAPAPAPALCTPPPAAHSSHAREHLFFTLKTTRGHQWQPDSVPPPPRTSTTLIFVGASQRQTLRRVQRRPRPLFHWYTYSGWVAYCACCVCCCWGTHNAITMTEPDCLRHPPSLAIAGHASALALRQFDASKAHHACNICGGTKVLAFGLKHGAPNSGGNDGMSTTTAMARGGGGLRRRRRGQRRAVGR